MRTTSKLENYNKILGENVVNKAHFFNFVHDIRSEELLKSREMSQFFESGGQTAKKRKLDWVVSNLVNDFFLFQSKSAFIKMLQNNFFLLLYAKYAFTKTLQFLYLF